MWLGTWAALASADAGFIGVQGNLFGPDDTPFTGTGSVTFLLYGDAGGAQELFRQELTVTFVDGGFGAYLNVDLDLFGAHPAMWVAVQPLGAAASTPVPVGSVPFAALARRALLAEDAAAIGGVDLAGLATQDELAALGDDVDALAAEVDSQFSSQEGRLSAVEGWDSRLSGVEQSAVDTQGALGAVSGRVASLEGGSTGFNPVGSLILFAGATTPDGYLVADGAAVSAALYPALCSVLGTTWGSAPAGQCRLPDLRDRFPKGVGVDALGASGGQASSAHTHSVTSAVSISSHGVTNGAMSRTTDVAVGNHTLSVANLPSHAHTMDHTHGSSSVSGSVGGGDGRHRHGVGTPYQHTWSARFGGFSHSQNFAFSPDAVNSTSGYGADPMFAHENWLWDSAHGHGFSLTAAGQSFSGSTGAAGSGSAISHSLTQPMFASNVTVADHSVTNGAVTSGAASTGENRPPYVSLTYLIKY